MAPTNWFERRSQRALPLWLLIAAIVLIAARIAFAIAARRGEGATVQWVPLAQAQRLARQERKLIMYDFTAEWCGPCHALDAQVFQNADLAARINEQFIAVRVLDRQREEGRNAPPVDEVQQRYTVGGFPTVVFADASGTERGRLEGFQGREQFERVVKSIR